MSAARVFLASSHVSCGFPSPAEDHLERALDFNELMVRNPAATFAVRVAGDSMVGAGIFPGDVAVVDRSLEPAKGDVVLALVDGEFALKRYHPGRDSVVLRAENPAYPDLVVARGRSLEVWGVVKFSVRVL